MWLRVMVGKVVLTPTKMLHPGDQVRVMTDEAVKARTEDILKQFDANSKK